MTEQNLLIELSNSLKSAVKTVRPYVVKVLDGTRFTASGVIWDAEGHVVATSHGVERDEDLAVELEGGVTVAAKLLGRDPESDIALLKIESQGLPAIEKSDLSEVGPGSIALALGRPGHSGLQVTMGVISALSREDKVLTTDAKLYPGFSGGALVDAEGKLLGLLNLSFGRGRGIALSHAAVSEIVAVLASSGSVQRGFLGVFTQPVELRHKAKTASGGLEGGLLVTSVAEGSPAEASGLLLGDVLLRIDQTDLGDFQDLRRVLGDRRAGEAIALRVLRAGTVVELNAVLGARE